MAYAFVRPGLLCAWYGPSLLLLSSDGEAGGEGSLTGFYHREARFLRTSRLAVNGERLWLCEAAATATDTLEFAYTYPEVAEYGGGGSGQSNDDEPRNAAGIAQRAIELRVRYQVRFDRLVVTAVIANRSREAVVFDVSWVFDADFLDIQEVQAGGPQRDEALPYHVVLHHDALWTEQDGRLVRALALKAGEVHDVVFEIQASTPGAIDEAGRLEREHHLSAWREAFTRIEAPGNRLFERVLDANIRDFASFPLLEGQRDEWLTLQAGVPLYPALFGRDAITAGWQAAVVDRGVSLDAALTCLGRLQTSRDSDWRDEEPGRIPYQVRRGPLAVLDVNPYAAYYADYASPLMYVIALANLYAWTGDVERVERHRDTARRILDWARSRGDIDGDGYLEYRTRSPKGTKNQGWKDSGDAIVYADGSPVPAPIATCELQGYWYAAQMLFGGLCWVRGDKEDAKAWLASAADLKQRFNRDWWVERESCIALAMDPEKRLIEAPTSNVGHCLASGIIDADHLPRVVGRLFAPDMFSGWGIRTLSSEHAFYNPVSYHRGTVWAVEQATTLFGLRRFGFDARAQDLAGALFDLSLLYPDYRIPECVGGYARGEFATPGAYPQANAPQLWNATAFPLMVQSLLGLLPVAPYELLMLDPALPAWLPEIVVHDLKVGAAQVSLRFWRDEPGKSHYEVLRKRGTLRVVRQPPPESLFAGAGDRAAALFETVTH